MSSFLPLCERAGTAYPINDFITQASAVLGPNRERLALKSRIIADALFHLPDMETR
jgi:hypothetical protein